PVVDGVVERRSREHEPVDERDGQANLDTAGQRTERATGGRAVDVQVVADACLERRHDQGGVVPDDPQVADEGFVQDRIDRGAVVCGTLGQPADAGALRHLVQYRYSNCTGT